MSLPRHRIRIMRQRIGKMADGLVLGATDKPKNRLTTRFSFRVRGDGKK